LKEPDRNVGSRLLQLEKFYRSDNWAYMLGYMPDEIVDSLDFWKEHIHPDDYDRQLKKLKSMSKT